MAISDNVILTFSHKNKYAETYIVNGCRIVTASTDSFSLMDCNGDKPVELLGGDVAFGT